MLSHKFVTTVFYIATEVFMSFVHFLSTQTCAFLFLYPLITSTAKQQHHVLNICSVATVLLNALLSLYRQSHLVGVTFPSDVQVEAQRGEVTCPKTHSLGGLGEIQTQTAQALKPPGNSIPKMPRALICYITQ